MMLLPGMVAPAVRPQSVLVVEPPAKILLHPDLDRMAGRGAPKRQR